ncbi:MAG: hypothetical protein JWQ90_454 [Hydrocarboniphaga sp.]|uniref:sulfotransferase family protein n=1 Tax=Hydrocarboniphaga sp. TaxID=2033016 RepID=UPI0026267545|nr:sulfotransferase [Hydrocarboniphaga sp.]MDB5968004.1 hypothetical protein [Hydrocarboniphaga sp.]
MPSRASAQDLITAAEQATGLNQWGDQDFRTGLALFIAAAQREARMSDLGWQRMLSRIDGLLKNRLRIIDYRAKHPEVAAQTITRPIFILGLPRSGTSNLLSLLSFDPAHRVPRMWEIYRSVPPPQRETYETDPRIAEVQQLLKSDGFDSEALQATHPFDSRLPEECGFIFEHTFACMVFPAYVNAPSFADYAMNKADWRGVYGFHKQFLQNLQTAYAGERWVLKTPEHSHFIPDLLATYSDAILLYTHRSPSAVMSSLASNITELRKLWSDQVDPNEVATSFLQAEAEGARRMVEARKDPAIDRHFYDIDFQDLIEHPVEVMQQLYRHFDLPYSEATRAGLQRYADHEAKKTHGHGKHKHALADYGYAPAQIDQAFKLYLEWYAANRDRIRLTTASA